MQRSDILVEGLYNVKLFSACCRKYARDYVCFKRAVSLANGKVRLLFRLFNHSWIGYPNLSIIVGQ